MVDTEIKSHTSRNNILIFVSLLLILFAKFGPSWGSLSPQGTITLSVMIVMALFWVLEPIPIYATALLPMAIFPLLEVATFKTIATNYANSNIYLFFGGFIIALALESTGMHKRISLNILKLVGTKPANIIAGFIIAPGLLSMWISNTATTVLMMPIAFSVLDSLKDTHSKIQHRHLTIALLLSIAFSASMGGMATFIGTPPNAIFSAFARDQGMNIGFGQFMLLGLPIAIGGFIILWIFFTKVFFKLGNKPIPGSTKIFHAELAKLQKMSYAEKSVLVVFIITALLWMSRQLIAGMLGNIGLTLSDPGIAMIAAITLFLLPNGEKTPEKSGRIVNWKDTKHLPWGILLLFGGGLALGQQIQATGVGLWIAGGMQKTLSEIPILLIIAFVTIVVSCLSQFASNTATTAALLPVLYPLAQATNIHPLFIMLPITLGASAVFMLPSATPPNAIVIAHEGLQIKDMVKYGGIINIVFILFVILMIYILLKLNIGFDVGDGTFAYFQNTMMR